MAAERPRQKCQSISVGFRFATDGFYRIHRMDGETNTPYIDVYPPSTGRATPVTYAELGDARKIAALSSSPSFP